MTTSSPGKPTTWVPGLTHEEAARILRDRLKRRIDQATSQIAQINLAMRLLERQKISFNEAHERIGEACLGLYDFSMLLQTIDFRGYAECAQVLESVRKPSDDQETP